MATDVVCYRVDVAEAYSFAEDYNAPVVIFAKGGLQDREHQLVVSVGDPVDEVDKHRGVQFSHAVYTVERPTPWPTDEDSWRFREVVMHDTHPLLSYWPKEPVSSGLWPWSPDPSGWFSKTHSTKDGPRVSWHELRSRGESSQDKWGMDVTITAGVAALYGVPKVHIAEIDSLSNVCVQVDSGPCETIDVEHAYLSVEDRHEDVLLWQNQGLDPYQQTRISIRLVKTGGNNLKIFPFKAIHYFEQQEYSSPDARVGRFEDVAIAHDDQEIVYHPGRRCLNYIAWWCAEWFDPWAWKEVGPSGSVLTYRSTVSSYRKTEDPSITLDFQGSAVYVYGAPKSFMKSGFAPQRVCINDACHVVDVEQAYLNAPETHIELAGVHSLRSLDMSNVTTPSAVHPELDPVLIWSMTGLDDKIQHSLRLALAELPSQDNTEMSIAKVVYTNVTYEPGQSRPDTPVPPDHADEGPLYPPHAIEWVPRLPSPDPTPPPPPPRPSQSKVPYMLGGTLVFFAICVFLVISYDSVDSPERWPIRPETPPPPYVPGPPPRPAPRPVRPNPPPVWPNTPSRPNPVPSRPSPTPVPPKVAPSPVQPIQQPSSIAGPSYNYPKPNEYGSNKPVLKSADRLGNTLVLPNPEVVKSSQKDQNNVGPCPGFNVAPPKPEYPSSIQKQPSVSSQKPPHSSTSVPVQTQSTTVPPLPTTRNTMSPVVDHRPNRSTPQAASSSSVATPAPKPTAPAVHNPVISSRVQVANTTRQPPHTAQPPKPSHTNQNTSVGPSTQARNSDSAVRRHERTVQPTPTKPTPNVQTTSQVTSKPLQPPVTQQTGPSVTPTPRPELPSPKPQENAYTPALAQWAQGQGYRIDRLMNAAARNEHPRPRIGAQRNQGQGRSAMPPFNSAAHESLDQGNTDWRTWRRIAGETGRIAPANTQAVQGAAPRNWREQGREEPERNHRVAPARNSIGMNPDVRARPGDAGGEVPVLAGANTRRARANNRRPNQTVKNNGQR